jgi:FtsZ-binding cell division protein ZapB
MNYGYSGHSLGEGSGFFNVRPDPAAVAPNPSLRFMTVDIQRMIITNTGKVGIGTTNPTHLIQLSGGAYSDGATWNPSSSVRWKENIEPLTDGVDMLKQLHPVAYNYKKTPEKRTMGFIAEEVGKVLPSVVDWDKAEPGYAEGYDHLAILALSVQALKEQQTRIEQLATRNSERQTEIEAMKDETEKLQERIAILERTVKQFAAR